MPVLYVKVMKQRDDQQPVLPMETSLKPEARL